MEDLEGDSKNHLYRNPTHASDTILFLSFLLPLLMLTLTLPATTTAAIATSVSMSASVSTIRELKQQSFFQPWTATGNDFETKSCSQSRTPIKTEFLPSISKLQNTGMHEQ